MKKQILFLFVVLFTSCTHINYWSYDFYQEDSFILKDNDTIAVFETLNLQPFNANAITTVLENEMKSDGRLVPVSHMIINEKIKANNIDPQNKWDKEFLSKLKTILNTKFVLKTEVTDFENVQFIDQEALLKYIHVKGTLYDLNKLKPVWTATLVKDHSIYQGPTYYNNTLSQTSYLMTLLYQKELTKCFKPLTENFKEKEETPLYDLYY